MSLLRVLAAIAMAALICACNRTPVSSTPFVPQSIDEQNVAPQEATTDSLFALSSTSGKIRAAHVFDSGISASQVAAARNRYDVIWGSFYPSMWRAADPSALVSRYYILNQDSIAISGHGLTYWREFRGRPDLNPGSWILYACTPGGSGTHEIAYTPGTGSAVAPNGMADVPLDIHNPYVRDYQIYSLAKYSIAHGYNALAIDEVILMPNVLRGGNPKFGQALIPGYFACGVWQGSRFVRHYSSPTDPAWSADVVAWIKRAHQLLTTDPTLAPYHLGLIMNHPAGPLNSAEETLLQNVTVAMNETGYSSYGKWRDSGYQGLFPMTLAWTRYAQQHGVRVVNIDKFAFTPTITSDQVDYSLATYLMGNEGAEDIVVTGAHYDVQPYYSQFQTTIGSPCGEYYRDPYNSAVYLRRFANAVVVVNSSLSYELAHVPSGHAYRDVMGLPLPRAFVLPPGTGYTLTTTNGCT